FIRTPETTRKAWSVEPLRIAVIGAGYWGKKVIRETLDVGRTTGRVQVHAVVDNSPTMLSHCQNEFGPLDYRLDYHELLTDPKLSGVHICSPNATHFEVASDFLKAGKNVLVEKPLTLRSKEAYKLVQLAKDNNIVICTGHINRIYNGVRELNRALAIFERGDHLCLDYASECLLQSIVIHIVYMYTTH